MIKPGLSDLQLMPPLRRPDIVSPGTYPCSLSNPAVVQTYQEVLLRGFIGTSGPTCLGIAWHYSDFSSYLKVGPCLGCSRCLFAQRQSLHPDVTVLAVFATLSSRPERATVLLLGAFGASMRLARMILAHRSCFRDHPATSQSDSMPSQTGHLADIASPKDLP